MTKEDFIGKKVKDFIDGEFIHTYDKEDFMKADHFIKDEGYGFYNFINYELERFDVSQIGVCEKETFLISVDMKDEVAIIEEGKVKAIINEYELVNLFVEYPILILPGHDSITTYNFETGEINRNYIR